jgi:seryl-tRNA synthetase
VIDINLLRENPEQIRASQVARGADVSLVDRAIDADKIRRAKQSEFENARAEQNAHGKLVAQAPKEQKQEMVAQAKELSSRVKALEAEAEQASRELSELMMRIDNVVLEGVPAGGEDDFVVLKEVGEIRDFDFEPKDHLELGEKLDIIDTERGAKVSGARFYFLKGAGAQLELAIMNMGLNLAIENGFTPAITPTLVRPETMSGTGFLGEHSAEVYYLENDELYLTGTSEVALAGLHSDEIIDPTDPIRYAGWSTCYRREAGSHGKDTRGILRVHQFNKLEMFSYCHPDHAQKEHERLLEFQEQMLSACELPYRVIDVAAGDLGSSAAKKYDVEAWVPTQGKYRELTSTSNCTTFQARRLNTRFKQDGKTHPVATLNGTLATTRWLVAILENHQREDGSVYVPKALQALIGKEIIEAKE